MYTAIELAKKLCEENKGKAFLKDDTDPNNVVLYCNRPDQIILPNNTGWYYAKGMFTNKHNTGSGAYDQITVLPKFYMDS